MKRKIVLVGAMMMVSAFIFAQQKGQNHHRKGELEKFRQELSLNDEQYASIKGINKKYHDQFSTIRRDSLMRKNDRMNKMKTLRNEKEREIKAVLTVDQNANYEKLKIAKKEERQAKMKIRVQERQEKMIRELALTNDQAASIKAANSDFMEKMKKLHAEQGVNKEAVNTLKKEHSQKVQSILTPEQFARWKEIKKSDRKTKRHKK